MFQIQMTETNSHFGPGKGGNWIPHNIFYPEAGCFESRILVIWICFGLRRALQQSQGLELVEKAQPSRFRISDFGFNQGLA
jgi:hypothetical protein